MNGVGYIYKITNIVNNKIYVGKTKKTIAIRYKSHLRQAEKNLELHKTSIPLYNAINEYGIDNFIIEEIEECPLDILDEREIYWIKQLKAQDPNIGYNICSGGEGGPGGPMFAGHHHSEETKQKMSLDRMGDKNSNYGNHWEQSDELRKLHSELSSGENNGMYGKTHSEESKKVNSDWHKNHIQMTNGKEDVWVSLDDVQLYQMAGYRKGRTFSRGKK